MAKNPKAKKQGKAGRSGAGRGKGKAKARRVVKGGKVKNHWSTRPGAMDCIKPQCRQRSKGPRHSFLCERHLSASRRDVAKWAEMKHARLAKAKGAKKAGAKKAGGKKGGR